MILHKLLPFNIAKITVTWTVRQPFWFFIWHVRAFSVTIRQPFWFFIRHFWAFCVVNILVLVNPLIIVIQHYTAIQMLVIVSTFHSIKVYQINTVFSSMSRIYWSLLAHLDERSMLGIILTFHLLFVSVNFSKLGRHFTRMVLYIICDYRIICKFKMADRPIMLS